MRDNMQRTAGTRMNKPRRHFPRLLRLCALSACLLLAACGAKMEGTYADPTGLSKYEFEPSGKVYVSLLGVRSEMKYEVDGKHVKITGTSSTFVLVKLDDGALEGPLGVKFRKQP
jgi:hypothetical protein